MIEELTAEQVKQMEVYKEEGLRIGLCTDRINRERAEIYGKRIMEWLGREYRGTIILDGPIQCNIAAVLLQQQDQIGDQIQDQVKQARGNLGNIKMVYPSLIGQYYAYYKVWCDYYRDVLKIDMPEYWQIADQCEFGMVYPLEHYCLICERPISIKKNENGLHCDGGPALQYKDDLTIYALNGVIVPEWLAVKPHFEIDPLKFAEIDNVEVRREFVRKVGIERISAACTKELLDKKGDYELLLIDLGGTTGEWPYLKMINPSIGTYHLECVAKDIKTVDEAIAWRNQSDIQPEQLT